MPNGVYSLKSSLPPNNQIIMTRQQPKMVILGGKSYKLSYLESSLNQIGNHIRSSVVRKNCNRRLRGHRQPAMHLSWIGYGHSWKKKIIIIEIWCKTCLILKWLYLWNRSTDIDTLTSGWKLLMSTFILAQQPACGTLTTGAAPPPPASSDNTDLVLSCFQWNWFFLARKVTETYFRPILGPKRGLGCR